MKIIYFLMISFFFIVGCENNSLEPVESESFTSWRLEIRKAGHIKYDIYNSYNVKVLTLVDEELGSGTWSFFWNNVDEKGVPVPEGIYIIKLYYDHSFANETSILVTRL